MKDDELGLLFIKGQGGDQGAYETCLSGIANLLKPYIFKKVSNANDHDDLIQTILMSVHDASHTYEKGRSFVTWVFAIANYKIADYFRYIYRHKNTELSDCLDTQIADSKSYQHVENKIDLESLLKPLTNDQRDLIRLQKLDGYPIKALATGLNKSSSFIKVNIHRAIGQLKGYVRRQYER